MYEVSERVIFPSFLVGTVFFVAGEDLGALITKIRERASARNGRDVPLSLLQILQTHQTKFS